MATAIPASTPRPACSRASPPRCSCARRWAGRDPARAIQALGLRINAALGGLHRTVELHEPIETETATPEQSLPALAQAIEQRRVRRLLVLDSNPAHTAPGELGFGELLGRLELAIHMGLYVDETARLCHWHLPLTHAFESWGDARAADGTATLIQPLVRPLWGARDPGAVLAMFLGRTSASARDEVRATWRASWPDGAGFADRWRGSLEAGFVEGTAAPPVRSPLQDFQVPTPVSGAAGLTALLPRPLPVGWPVRRQPAAPGAAEAVEQGDLEHGGRCSARSGRAARAAERGHCRREGRGGAIRGPAWIAPGHSEDGVTLYLGGRDVAGGTSYAYRLRPAQSPWRIAGVELTATGQHGGLAQSQLHHRMEGRDLVRRMSPEQLQRGEPVESALPLPSLYPAWDSPDRAWAMVIDTDAWIGCNACVLACQTENNVPVVGREEVERGRLTHWLRVDAIIWAKPATRVRGLRADPRHFTLLRALGTGRARPIWPRSRRGRGRGERRLMAAASLSRRGYLPAETSYRSITDEVALVPFRFPAGIKWYALLGASGLLVVVFLVSVAWLFWFGVGVWGNQTPVYWGLAITNYVWWISMAHAGTLISALLLIMNRGWRNTLNRFAEAMTVFAVMMAGLYPILHLGRPWLFHYLFPYPSTFGVWPQFKSPLLWDVAAVLTYLIVSVLFWYIGLVPDLATLRDRARWRPAQLSMACWRWAGVTPPFTGDDGRSPIGPSRHWPCRWSPRSRPAWRCCSPTASSPAGIRPCFRPTSCSARSMKASPRSS